MKVELPSLKCDRFLNVFLNLKVFNVTTSSVLYT